MAMDAICMLGAHKIMNMAIILTLIVSLTLTLSSSSSNSSSFFIDKITCKLFVHGT